MASHIQHLRSISSLSLSALRVMHAKQTLEASNDENDETNTLFSEPIIRSIAEEYMRIDGKECKVRRIFIKTADSGEYKYVGWMLNEDVRSIIVERVVTSFVTPAARTMPSWIYSLDSDSPEFVTNATGDSLLIQEVVYANVNFSTDMNGRVVIENLPKRV
eukprot:gene36109-46942_t